jgi:DNA-binding transcriptional ArsR family regulator
MNQVEATLDQTLVALAEPTRRQVIVLLCEQPRRAGELASRAGTSPPAMSRHLRVLRRCGLIEEEPSERDYRVRTYKLRRERFDELDRWLQHVRQAWTEQLASFKDYVERAPAPQEKNRPGTS